MTVYNLLVFEEALNLLTEMSSQEFDARGCQCLCCVGDG